MKNKNLQLTILIVLFLFLRFYQLPRSVNFSMDQGTTLLTLYNLWQEKKITLIGPETSIQSVDKHSFFHGPWIYYFLLPFMLISRWEPLAGSFLFISLNLLALVFLYQGAKQKFGLKTAFITGLIFTFSPKMIYFSQFFWNPNFLPLCSCLLLYLWSKISKKKVNLTFFFLAGLIIGFGLGNHYLFFLLAILFTLSMLLQKHSWKSFFVLIEGVIISLTPLIIFELKHDFYNLKTVLSIIKYGTEKQINFPLPFHHYLSLIPLVYMLAALLIKKVYQKSALLGNGIVIIYILF